MKAISVRLDEATHSQLEERSTRLGIPPAVLARAFILGALGIGTDPTISPSFPDLPPASTSATGPAPPKKSKKRR
jgi:hypothetical protein